MDLLARETIIQAFLWRVSVEWISDWAAIKLKDRHHRGGEGGRVLPQALWDSRHP